MLLMGTSTAWSAYYAVGPAVGGWSTWVELKTTDNNKYTCLASPGEFKITSKKDAWDFDKNWDNVGAGTGVTKNGGGNASLNSGKNQICFYPTGNNNEGRLEGETVTVTASSYVLGGYFDSKDKNYSNGKKLTKNSDGTYYIEFNDIGGDSYFQIYDDVARIWGCDYIEKNVGESVTLSISKGDKVRYTLTKGTSYVATFNPSNGSFSIILACTSANFSVSLSSSSVTVGQANIKASIKGTHSPAVTWSSSDSNIATIDANGNIKTNKYGKVTITATTKGTDSYCSGTQQTAELTVKETPTITIEGNTTFCGESTTLTAKIEGLTSGNSHTVKWYKEGNNTAISTGSSYSPKETGKFIAEVTGTYVNTTNKTVSVTKKATPIASNFTYTEPTSLTYDGSEKSAKVVWYGTQGGTITVKYSSTSDKYTEATPKEVGTYYVYITTDETTDYCAATDLYIGDFTITCPALTAPTVSVNQHIVKCGTDVTQKGKITISGLVTGNTYTYKVGDNGSAKSLTFTGSTATLDNLVEGGKYIVTASNGCSTKSDNATVDVTTNTKATLSWDMPAKGFLVADETITAQLEPAEAGTITYNTSDITVIGISNGILTAQPNKNGTANITATPSLNSGYCGATDRTENLPVKFFNVAGTENLCGDGDGIDEGPENNKEAWNTTSHPMRYDETNKVWYRTFKAKPAGEYQFQITHETWDWASIVRDENNGNIKCNEIHITTGGDWKNIVFTTPTKGNITIKYTEANGAYVEFEEICITDDDVSAGTINAPESLCGVKDFTLALEGTTSLSDYVTSVQWQKKNSNGWEYTSAEQKNLTSGTHIYKAIVTWTCSWTERDGSAKSCTKTKETGEFSVKVQEPISDLKMEITSDAKDVYCSGDKVNVKVTYKGDIRKSTLTYDEKQIYISGGAIVNNATFNFTIKQSGIVTLELEDCNGEKHTAQLSFTVMDAPTVPEIEVVQSEIIKCGESFIKKGKVWIKNHQSSYVYVIGDNDNSPINAVTEEDGNAYIYFDFAGSFTIKAKNTCDVFSGKTTSGGIIITETNVKVTPTLSSTPIVKCGEGDNAYTPGTLVITNYNADYNYTIEPSVGTSTIDGTNATYSINAQTATEYTVIATHKEYNCSSVQAKTTVALTDNTPSATVTVNTDRERLCADNDVVLTCDVKNLDGNITGYVWKNANGEQVATGEALSTITIKNVTASTTYSVVVTVVKNGCSKDFEASVNLDVKSRPEAPKFDDEKMTACTGVPFSLPMPNNLKEDEEPVWTIEDKLVPAGNVTLDKKGDYEFKAYKNDGCISDATKFIVTVNPTPTITLKANNETVNVGETVTLSVSGSDFAELKWSATDGTKSYTVTPGANNTATITTDENALITVTVVAKSDAGCETSASIDLTFGSEDCENANADYIEILCRRTDNPASTDADRDMHCYAWDPNTDKTYLGGWPGVKTDDGDFEYKGKKYAVWQIKTNSDIYIIFSNGNDSQKTGDIKGPNDAGLKKGYRYVYTLSSDYKTAKLYEESIIFAPEVKTLSATCARQSDNSLKVTVTGKIMKKGCADISSYGFQQIYNNEYTNIEVGTTDHDAGFIFTKDITLAAGKYGEYTFRARLINENSSKVYGEKITIYYSESDVLIAAVGDDTKVTNKDGVYYDFVGLYVKNVMLPAGVKVKSYQWYKGDAVYNGGNVTVADRGVSAANNNIRPSEAGAYKCVVTLDNNTTLTSNVITVSETSTYADDKVTSSNRNLPVISVRTNVAFPTCETAGTTGKYPSTNIEGWKEKRSVDVKIFNADGTLYYDRKARMNYRGSSSLNFNKKSYAFCPGDADCGNDKGPDYVETMKMNLFGLSNGAEDKDWVLYAAAADPTLMRNRLVFDTYAKMTGEWGVNSMFVELVINGEYQGVYVLMDKITNNENRVYVGKYGKSDYTGGFIVKFDKTDVADRERNLVAGQEIGDEKTFRTVRTGRTDVYTYGTHVDQLFEIEYPEKKDVEKAGASWSTTLNAIKQRFQDFEDALEKGEFLKVRSIIDYESWADWFIINEFTKNLDAYRASCVFTCKGEGQKIEALPLWDQELSFNNGAANIAGKGADNTKGLLIENDGVYKDCFPAPFWFTGRVAYFNNCDVDGGKSSENPRLEYYLLKDECFIQTIKDRWEIHIAEGGALHNKTLTDKVDALLTELGAAKSRETTKWPSNHRVSAACDGGGTGYNNVGFDASKTALVNWVGGELNADATSENSSNSRVTNLNYLINQMQGEPLQFNLVLNPGNGVTTPWVPVTLTVEAPAGYDYTYDDSEVEAAEGVIIKKLGNDAYSYTFPRPEAWGTGNDANASDPRDPRQYGVKVTLNVETVDNTCGTVDTEKHATITLEDEGDDNCSYTDQ